MKWNCGHPKTSANTRTNHPNPGGRCRTCYNATLRRWYERNRIKKIEWVARWGNTIAGITSRAKTDIRQNARKRGNR